MQGVDRRLFLVSLAAATYAAEPTAKGRVFPSVAVRYPDPATEITILRLGQDLFACRDLTDPP